MVQQNQDARKIYPSQTSFGNQYYEPSGHQTPAAWSRNGANIPFPSTPNTTTDMPPSSGNPNGGLSHKRGGVYQPRHESQQRHAFPPREEHQRDDDSHLGTKRRKTGRNDYHSSVVAPESITSDMKQYTGQNKRSLDTGAAPPAGRGSSRPGPTSHIAPRRDAAMEAITDWRDPQLKNDILRRNAYVRRQFFYANREGIEDYYATEHQVLIQDDEDKPQPKVGDIHLILDQEILADSDPARLGNTHIVPGPEGIKTLYKTTPALVVSTEERDIVYKVLTTKHNTDHSKPYVQRDLSKNFVLMRRVDDNGAMIDNSAAMAPRFDQLDFIGVSDYDWDPKPYFPVAKLHHVPRCAPWRFLGWLFDASDRAKLYNIMQEGDRRVYAGIVRTLPQPAPQMKDTVASQVMSLIHHTKQLLTTVVAPASRRPGYGANANCAHVHCQDSRRYRCCSHSRVHQTERASCGVCGGNQTRG
jgi:hypothetical protein